MAPLFNLARMTVASSGTGDITLSNAVQGFLTFDLSGVSTAAAGQSISYAINDTNNSEIGTGVYYSSSLRVTRVPAKSTNGNAAIDMSNAAQVFITPQANDLYPVPVTNGGTGSLTQESSNRVLITGTNGVHTTLPALTFLSSAGGGLNVGSTTAGSSLYGGAITSSAGGISIGGAAYFGSGGFLTDTSSVALNVPVGNVAALLIQDSSGTTLLNIHTNNTSLSAAEMTFGVTAASVSNGGVLRNRQNWYFAPVTHSWSAAANITGTSSRANNEMVLDQTTHMITDATGARTVTELNGLYILGGPIIADSGGFTATVTSNYAFRVGNLTIVGANGAVTNAYGGYIQKPTGASNNYSLLTDGAIINTETVNASSSGIGSIQTTGGLFTGLGIYGSSNATFGGALSVSGGISGSSAASFYSGVSTPAGGSTQVGVVLGAGLGLGIYFGSGAPTLLANQGSLYLRNNGSSVSRLYVAASSSGSWVSFTQST